ncbi:GNAT family N-acetyltransferase [Ralstonia sp. 1138]|uniref:GNAT family N-acetyltransferase n=1 Tax=Ralstonia sp. 1138 TaxID=3156423 RepID=UPI0033931996
MVSQSLSIMQVRAANLADLNQLSDLFNRYRGFYQQPDDLALARAFLSERLQCHDSIIFVADADSRLLGFAQLYPTFSSISAKRAWILNDLFVAANSRQRGVAGALLAEVINHARESGAAWVNLETASDNVVAQELYRKFGFQPEQNYLTLSHSFS